MEGEEATIEIMGNIVIIVEIQHFPHQMAHQEERNCLQQLNWQNNQQNNQPNQQKNNGPTTNMVTVVEVKVMAITR